MQLSSSLTNTLPSEGHQKRPRPLFGGPWICTSGLASLTDLAVMHDTIICPRRFLRAWEVGMAGPLAEEGGSGQTRGREDEKPTPDLVEVSLASPTHPAPLPLAAWLPACQPARFTRRYSGGGCSASTSSKGLRVTSSSRSLALSILMCALSSLPMSFCFQVRVQRQLSRVAARLSTTSSARSHTYPPLPSSPALCCLPLCSYAIHGKPERGSLCPHSFRCLSLLTLSSPLAHSAFSRTIPRRG